MSDKDLSIMFLLVLILSCLWFVLAVTEDMPL